MIEPEQLFRIYAPDECGEDGYPFAWHKPSNAYASEKLGHDLVLAEREFSAVKDLVRENAGNRCLRCGHPYTKGQHSMEPDPEQPGEFVSWSPCDSQCSHMGPVRLREIFRPGEQPWVEHDLSMHGQTAAEAMMDEGPERLQQRYECDARWRVLTVHHLLTGPEGKRNLLWWNLVSLCQRCHLRVQRLVDLRRVYPWPHTEWFRPYAAGWYAWSYLGESLTRAEAMSRLPELLALEDFTQ